MEKTIAKTIGTVALALLLVGTTLPALAQAPGGRAMRPAGGLRPGGTAGARPVEPNPGEPIPEIVFREGGAVADYVNLLKEKTGANIVLDDEVASTPMPAVSLKNVSVLTALNLIPMLAKPGAGKVINMNPVGGEGGDPEPVYVLQMSATPPQPMMRMMPGAIPMVAEAGPRAAAQRLEVFSLNELLSAEKDEAARKRRNETILTAIKQGLDELGTSFDGVNVPAATLKYHEDSGLLFVKGNDQQIAVVKDVLTKLGGAQKQKSADVLDASLKAQVNENESLRRKNDELMMEIKSLQWKIEQMQLRFGQERPKQQ